MNERNFCYICFYFITICFYIKGFRLKVDDMKENAMNILIIDTKEKQKTIDRHYAKSSP